MHRATISKLSGNAAIAQSVERILGKDEVASSNLASSSKKALEPQRFWGFCFFADILAAQKTTTKTTTLIEKMTGQVLNLPGFFMPVSV